MIFEKFRVIAFTERRILGEPPTGVARMARLLPDGKLDPECSVDLTLPDGTLFREVQPGKDFVVSFMSVEESKAYGLGARMM